MNRILSTLFLSLIAAGAVSAQEAAGGEWKKDGEVKADVTAASDESEPDFQKWRLAIQGGYSRRLYRTGSMLSVAESKYTRDFKSGISYGGELDFFPWKHVGIGARFDQYESAAEMSGDLREEVTIQFIGGSLVHRAFLKNPWNSVLTSLLLGYQPYVNHATVGAENLTFRGNTMSWGVSVGLEHRIGKRFAIHITGTALMGAVYRLQRKTAFSLETLHLSKDDSVDLSRASVSVGLRFF